MDILADLYHARSKIANFGFAKTPGLNDRKLLHIKNMEQLAIIQPRELSHCRNLLFWAARGILMSISTSVLDEAYVLK